MIDELDAESGSITEELWRADVRTAEGPAAVPARTNGQRCADALVELAPRAGTSDRSSSKRHRPALIVNVDTDVLVAQAGGAAETAHGEVLTGDAVRRLACDAQSIRAVTDGTSEILDLGRSTPTPNAAQRRALALRDGGCLFPSCDRPPAWCDAHHLDRYRRGSHEGGRTDLDDLGLFCRHHHGLLHEGDYRAWRDIESARSTSRALTARRSCNGRADRESTDNRGGLRSGIARAAKAASSSRPDAPVNAPLPSDLRDGAQAHTPFVPLEASVRRTAAS